MSSHPSFAAISPDEMEMIQSVLKSAGYNATVLGNDQRQFNTAAFLVMKLFLAGATSADALAARLKRRLGNADSLGHFRQSPPVLAVVKSVPRNAIYVLNFFRKPGDRSIEGR
ncbi:hypothetical protein [Agrobacterium tumefaciens]|jgi:hypothetical protein|uniref:hypothetical protein n=1 Tax=Agrobacterium tumefaciens TaxID=358 RepID=UPI000DDB7A0B|nr:hypothetical protein [Agrobacterium tumefaciens]MDR6590110.1 hypothetical protein [Agrobacterium tumefaciens]